MCMTMYIYGYVCVNDTKDVTIRRYGWFLTCKWTLIPSDYQLFEDSYLFQLRDRSWNHFGGKSHQVCCRIALHCTLEKETSVIMLLALLYFVWIFIGVKDFASFDCSIYSQVNFVFSVSKNILQNSLVLRVLYKVWQQAQMVTIALLLLSTWSLLPYEQ